MRCWRKKKVIFHLKHCFKNVPMSPSKNMRAFQARECWNGISNSGLWLGVLLAQMFSHHHNELRLYPGHWACQFLSPFWLSQGVYLSDARWGAGSFLAGSNCIRLQMLRWSQMKKDKTGIEKQKCTWRIHFQNCSVVHWMCIGCDHGIHRVISLAEKHDGPKGKAFCGPGSPGWNAVVTSTGQQKECSVL